MSRNRPRKFDAPLHIRNSSSDRETIFVLAQSRHVFGSCHFTNCSFAFQLCISGDLHVVLNSFCASNEHSSLLFAVPSSGRATQAWPGSRAAGLARRSSKNFRSTWPGFKKCIFILAKKIFFARVYPGCPNCLSISQVVPDLQSKNLRS